MRTSVSGLLVAMLGAADLFAQQPQAPPTAAQQRPVFRGGTHFVRVDAYPARDGKVIEGLTPDDFEITEDGKPQTIESFDFIRFDTFTPEAERYDPASQRDGFDLAADPRYRVFVIVVDMPASGSPGSPTLSAQRPSGGSGVATSLSYIRQPLVNFLDRVLGPHDLFGFLTSRNTAKDLVLGQKTTAVEAQIDDLVRAENMDRDEADDLDRCTWPGEHRGGRVFDPSILKALSRADALYNALEGLVSQLGSLRQERKNVILVSNRLSRARPRSSLVDEAGVAPPRIGITNGRIGIGTRDNPTVANDSYCSGELLRLASIDFDVRYRQLLRDARDANVAFYPVMPAGLQAQSGGAPGSSAPVDDLISLAHETDGIPAVNTNDLDTGMRKIADDLGAYYLLGYYTTNTNWDGGIRTITVKLKSSGASVRARREYRAPTQAEMAALASAATAKPAEPAPPHASLIGEPTVYTLALHAPPKAVATRQFARTDRLRIEWPILAEADNRQARILDSAGKPLPIDLPLSEAGGKLATELPLAPFARGDYQIELTATAATGTDRKVVTIMIR